MITNETLQKDVQDAIKWEPLLHAAEIGVTAKDGVVTLTGTVNSFAKKTEAEDAAKRTKGVKAVVENIKIKFDGIGKKNDGEIANEILNALKWNNSIPEGKVTVKVENGWVTLDGELQWNSQKEAARKAVCNLLGVKLVTNNIIIKSEIHDEVNKRDIELALLRNVAINDKFIQVNVKGNMVTLTGKVDSWYMKDEVARLAWNAPGVWAVENELVVEFNN